jgi:hypothetical protein
MAAASFGTAHFYGIGSTLTNATIISIDTNVEFENDDTTIKEDGLVAEERMDARVYTASVTLRIKTGYTFPNIGAVITLAGLGDTTFNKNYAIISKGQAYRNNAHVEQTLELRHREGITYTP